VAVKQNGEISVEINKTAGELLKRRDNKKSFKRRATRGGASSQKLKKMH
jgi:hypothetical protein